MDRGVVVIYNGGVGTDQSDRIIGREKGVRVSSWAMAQREQINW
jgi:hypothetical protein